VTKRRDAKAGNGTQPLPLQRMLRIHFMQHWLNLRDPGMEVALYDSESIRRFAGIELTKDAVGRTPWRLINRARSMGRARCEQAFQVIKHLWGFTKVRCRGLAKNTARLFTAFAPSNLYLMRRRLSPSQAKCPS
jgi:IS5 family transposase